MWKEIPASTAAVEAFIVKKLNAWLDLSLYPDGRNCQNRVIAKIEKRRPLLKDRNSQSLGQMWDWLGVGSCKHFRTP
jgi:hypothetical protein